MKKLKYKWDYYKRTIPLYWVIIIVLAVALPFNIYINHFNKPLALNIDTIENCNLPYNIIRENTKTLVKPLMLVETTTENEDYFPLKDKINTYINEHKDNNILRNASVYFRILDVPDGWFVINNEEQYNYASLMKISFAIAMLREADKNPDILNKTYYFALHGKNFKGEQKMLDHQLPPEKNYSYKELLKYALAYSDNDAAMAVLDHINLNSLQKLLSDLHLPPCDLHQEYLGSVEGYSRFFRVLYNAGYLSPDMSEFALELLSESDFNDGIVKNLDKTIKVPRKFGERGLDNNLELHEFGIVYYKNRPYLLGVMTKGRNYDELKKVIADISSIVFEDMNKAI
ncbi:MAG: serine hydrolase [Bacteroidota bacterium]